MTYPSKPTEYNRRYGYIFDIIITSGYFHPIHPGHIEYFSEATKLASYHIVVVNNDLQTLNKSGKVIMSDQDRAIIVAAIEYVDEVVISIDNGQDISHTIKMIRKKYPKHYIGFLNDGGEYSKCLEQDVCDELGIKCVYGSNKKIDSSSRIRGL